MFGVQQECQIMMLVKDRHFSGREADESRSTSILERNFIRDHSNPSIYHLTTLTNIRETSARI
jgi:hypothetical protein